MAPTTADGNPNDSALSTSASTLAIRAFHSQGNRSAGSSSGNSGIAWNAGGCDSTARSAACPRRPLIGPASSSNDGVSPRMTLGAVRSGAARGGGAAGTTGVCVTGVRNSGGGRAVKTGADSAADAGAGMGMGVGAGADASSGVGAGASSGVGAGAGSGVGAGASSGVGAGVGASAGAGSGAGGAFVSGRRAVVTCAQAADAQPRLSVQQSR